MDTTQFDLLTQCIHRLLGILAHAKAENARLSQSLSALRDSQQAQERDSVAWETVQAELRDLRTVIHTLRQERELIRTKLEAMLGMLQHLEGLPSAVEKP